MQEIRSELGLTQAQLATLIGGSAALMSNYETGQRNIPAKTALLLECMLEISRLGGNIETPINRAKKPAPN